MARGVLPLCKRNLPCLAPPIPRFATGGAARPGCKNTQFIVYTPEFVQTVTAVSPTKGRMLQEVLPFVPTHKGGISKELASFVLSSFEKGLEIKVSSDAHSGGRTAGSVRLLNLHVPLCCDSVQLGGRRLGSSSGAQRSAAGPCPVLFARLRLGLRRNASGRSGRLRPSRPHPASLRPR